MNCHSEVPKSEAMNRRNDPSVQLYRDASFGSSIYDIHKKIRFLLPLPTCVHMRLTPPLVDVDIKYT